MNIEHLTTLVTKVLSHRKSGDLSKVIWGRVLRYKRRLSVGLKNELMDSPKMIQLSNYLGNHHSIPDSRCSSTLKVAVIADDFTRACFRYEWEQTDLTPENWRLYLDKNDYDLLFVESAWVGPHASWQGHLFRNPSETVVSIVRLCNEKGIPTVFWNKEDPVHIEDFVESARLFDYVFTSDIDSIDTYRRYGVKNVDCMSFAVQPRLHNPIRRGGAKTRSGIFFAGTYYSNRFEERRRLLESQLDAAIKISSYQSCSFRIYPRFVQKNRKYRYPERYRKFLSRPLSYLETLDRFHRYMIGLNVNTVADSKTMLSRRLIEGYASGCLMITSPSNAIHHYFPTFDIPVCESVEEAAAAINRYLNCRKDRDHLIHRAQRELWSHHTYADRVKDLCSRVGLDYAAPDLTVSAICSTRRPENIYLIRDTLLKLAEGTNNRLEICIGIHGFRLSSQDREVLEEIPEVKIFSYDSNVPLGTVYNRLIGESSGQVIAKIDDDDFYGREYLNDQVAALRFSQAAIVGKGAYYCYLPGLGYSGLVSAEKENCYVDLIAGPTIVAWRSTFEKVPFSPVTVGEDTRFLREASRIGLSIYSSDRFNFVRYRLNKDQHTWSQGTLHFIERSKAISKDFPDEAIC